jgi:hypothetical protein
MQAKFTGWGRLLPFLQENADRVAIDMRHLADNGNIGADPSVSQAARSA